MKATTFGWLVVTLALSACDAWPGVSGDGGVTGGTTQVEDSSGNFGSSCSSSGKACATGLNCISAAPNGLCTKTCSSDNDCGLYSAKCLLAFGSMLCIKTCASNQMCRPGYTCQTTSSGQVCLQGTLPDL